MAGGKKKAPHQPVVEVEEEEEEEEMEEEEEEEFDLRGYLKSVPLQKRRRLYALKSLLGQTKKFEEEMQEKILALQSATLAKLWPLLEERRKIVTGEREPTEAEVLKAAEVIPEEPTSKVEVLESSDEEDKKKKERKGVKIVAPKDEDDKDNLKKADADPKGGIPGFWLRALQNNEVIEPSILPQDEAVLKHLEDLTYEFVDGSARNGYKITFTFADSNPFFGKKQLTKEYLMDLEDDESEVLDKAVGCDIDWKDAATNPTVQLKQKKQRKKGSTDVRVITREEKRPSFFHFFAPPGNDTDEGEEDEEELMDMENDYEAGNALKDAVIPRAVYYFSGQVISDLAGAFGDEEGAEWGDEEEEDEEDEDDEE